MKKIIHVAQNKQTKKKNPNHAIQGCISVPPLLSQIVTNSELKITQFLFCTSRHLEPEASEITILLWNPRHVPFTCYFSYLKSPILPGSLSLLPSHSCQHTITECYHPTHSAACIHVLAFLLYSLWLIRNTQTVQDNLDVLDLNPFGL